MSVYGRVIVDLGDQFNVFDKDGEPPLELKVESITDGIVQLPKGQKHSLQDGDIVSFKEVLHEEGAAGEDLNGAELRIKVINKSSFILEGFENYKKWQRNGIAVQ
jgi:predicted RecA/RadA family phage recombinase